jgi:SAM-dependent methyltransferase
MVEAIGIDLDHPGYDGRTLPFGDGSPDAVYSSHCLEHIPDYVKAIQEWYRVTKVNGHIITVVPNAALYERRKRPPSMHNRGHVRFYTPASLVAAFGAALQANSCRVRHLAENNYGYRYDTDPESHPVGCYEIELVIQKISPQPGR